jgi:hypothetical protein
MSVLNKKRGTSRPAAAFHPERREELAMQKPQLMPLRVAIVYVAKNRKGVDSGK